MRCELCGTPLNSYNRGPRCHAHTKGTIVYEHVPRASCGIPVRGGMYPVSDNEEVRRPRTISPLDSSDFIDQAFSLYPVGQVREDGTVRYFKDGEEEE